MIDWLRARIVLFVLAATVHTGGAAADTWRFAVIGDTPYNDYERRQFPPLLADIVQSDVAFIIHVGDFKDSGAVCSDVLFRDRRALFHSSPVPLIYVPGDNEWIDCRHLRPGHFDPLERLRKLRELFYAEPRALGQRMLIVDRQPGDYPEHLRWRRGAVLFLTLNVPGPNNNFGMGQRASREFLDRNPQIIAWLEEGFALARREGLAGIVIAMQGDPGFRDAAAGHPHSGYRDLLTTLQRETMRFAGQVLLLHGDTHHLRIDKPLRHPQTRQILDNFTRVETFGHPLMGWVKIDVDRDDPQLFRFQAFQHRPR